MNYSGQTQTPSKWQTTEKPVLYSSFPDISETWFRPVLIGEEYFGYRAYDYKGGFYICTQIAVADKQEVKRKVAFDDIREQYVYLMHYVPTGGRANPNSWEIQNYQMYCMELPSLQSLDTINFETIAGDRNWKQALDIRHPNPSMPDYYMLWNSLDEQVTKYEFRIQHYDKFDELMRVEPEWDIVGLVRQLTAQGKYDTIVKTDNSTIYVNTDYFCYEIADDPAAFWVIERRYHPNGMLKSLGYFLPGVHRNESMRLGYYHVWDEKGEQVYGEAVNSLFYATGLNYYLRWMEKRNYIDFETGKGKPTMIINAHVDPHGPSHGEPRVRIESNWQIQFEEDTQTADILIKCDDGKETVFIFANNSKIIWDKFDR